MTQTKRSILISIHPCFATKIMKGEKKYEFRKKVPEHTSQMVIYATSPVKAVIGIAEIEAVLSDVPDNLWRKTKHSSGISRKYFGEYFKNAKKGYALKIGRVIPFETPINLNNLTPALSPPQSYQYMTDVAVEELKKELCFQS